MLPAGLCKQKLVLSLQLFAVLISFFFSQEMFKSLKAKSIKYFYYLKLLCANLNKFCVLKSRNPDLKFKASRQVISANKKMSICMMFNDKLSLLTFSLFAYAFCLSQN